ncbi:hypothetical protein [Palleronia sp. LCG004]|uniref:hypothetical protein n=1 Tax=Palleronia sp. LCG004 TaxID=3079304 RepID=UPI002942D189|nr:hypothetical protein [Palleronia sp. LCG004]WOI57478.1 hypothetical protein RVY76_06765 [Palleronia sp. LCG004]
MIAILTAFLGLTSFSLAQTVAVENGLGERGFGWMFSRAGTCYAVLPRHVAGAFPRISVTSAAPVVTGTGTTIAPFWDGIDLALAVLRGAIEERCTAELDDLDPDRTNAAATRVQLLRLGGTGEEERLPLRIEDRGYLTFTGLVEEAGDSIAQGTSGAFAFAAGQPVGMAITSDDPTRAQFMRSEEIRMNVSRYLGEQATAFARATAPSADADRPGLSMRLVSSSVPPDNPRHAPENMIGDGTFVFAPARDMMFEFALDAGALVRVGRLRVTSPVGEGYSLPKSVLLRYAVDSEGTRFRDWKRLEMGLDGVLDTGPASTTIPMTRLRMHVFDAWSPGLIAISSVTAEGG